MTHTPTPWTVHTVAAGLDAPENDPDIGTWVVPNDAEQFGLNWIAKMVHKNEPANAALIVRAVNCHEELVAALEIIEDLLGFHKGSEEKITKSGHPVIWINASDTDGDFQTMLSTARAALAKAKP